MSDQEIDSYKSNKEDRQLGTLKVIGQKQNETLSAGTLIIIENPGDSTFSQDSNNEPLVNSEKSSHHPIHVHSSLKQASALKPTTIVEKRNNKKISLFLPNLKQNYFHC